MGLSQTVRPKLGQIWTYFKTEKSLHLQNKKLTKAYELLISSGNILGRNVSRADVVTLVSKSSRIRYILVVCRDLRMCSGKTKILACFTPAQTTYSSCSKVIELVNRVENIFNILGHAWNRRFLFISLPWEPIATKTHCQKSFVACLYYYCKAWFWWMNVWLICFCPESLSSRLTLLVMSKICSSNCQTIYSVVFLI